MPEHSIASTTPLRRYTAERQLYFKKDTGFWYIRIVRPGQRDRWVSTGTTDKVAALRRLHETGIDRLVEVAGDERFKAAVVEAINSADRTTLEEVIDAWLADQALRLRSSSMAHPRAISRQFLELFAPRTAIGAITPARIGAWVNTGFTLTQRQRRLSVLESLFQYAFDQGKRKDNPAKRVGLKLEDLTIEQMERTMREPFTADERKRFINCAANAGFWHWAFELGWWLGLRIGDCCCLEWGSFCAEPGKLVVWQRKTRRRIGLDLNDPLLGAGAMNPVFAAIKAEPADPTWCFPVQRELYLSKNRREVSYQFYRACIAAGLDGDKTFHCLRKTAALRWQEAGRSLEEIGRMLGHGRTENTGYYLEK